MSNTNDATRELRAMLVRWAILIILVGAFAMKLKTKLLGAFLTLTTMVGLGIATAMAKPNDEKTVAELPKCPVMDEPVDFRISTMTDEGPVYFCCKMCVGKFNKDPKKYAEKTKVQRKALAKRDRVQVTCPISGEAIDKDVHDSGCMRPGELHRWRYHLCRLQQQ